MKAKITNVVKHDNTNSSFTVQILNENEDVIYETTRGFVSQSSDPTQIETEILKALENIKDQYVNETSSIASESILAKVGEIISLPVKDANKEAAVVASAISIKNKKEVSEL